MILQETYTLANGVKIPKIGLGTWLIKNDIVAQAVIDAVKVGYRHIDTAQDYFNEQGVGEGVNKCGLKREEIFVTTKVSASHKTYQSAIDSIEKSIKKLNIDYIDLVIIHCPEPWDEFRGKNHYFKENKEVWKALEAEYKAGKIKAIGVSNFLIEDLQNILEDCEIKPMINQILLHPGEYPVKLVDFCKKNKILVEAYSPIAHGSALDKPFLVQMAEKYKVSVPALCIRYTLQLGTVSLPKTANIEHMKDNAKVDFVISNEDMDIINKYDFNNYTRDDYFPCYSKK